MKKVSTLFFTSLKILPFLIMILLISFCRQVNKGNDKRPQQQATIPLQTDARVTGETLPNGSTVKSVNNLSAAMTFPNSQIIYIFKDTITLFWNAAVNYVDTVLFYELYYNNNTDTTWYPLIKKIPVSANPQVKVSRNDVVFNPPDSIFYFKVLCVTQEGVQSDWNESCDSIANPPKGWHIRWCTTQTTK